MKFENTNLLFLTKSVAKDSMHKKLDFFQKSPNPFLQNFFAVFVMISVCLFVVNSRNFEIKREVNYR